MNNNLESKPADSATLFNQLFTPAAPAAKAAPSLLTVTPSFIHWDQLDGWTLYTAYYGVPDGKPELLPLGAHYGCVFSPGPFTPATRAGWRYCRFLVVMSHSRFKAGKPIDEKSRMYREVRDSARYLNESEVSHLSFVIEETIKGLQAG